MNERNQIILKFIATHILLLPVLIILSLIFKSDGILLLSIIQTVFFILFYAGYWEFIGRWLKWNYFLGIEIILLTLATIKCFSGIAEYPELHMIIPFALLQAFLINILVKIAIVVFKNDREKLEIEFPFKLGMYLITDGGNSKISRLMNYHFHSVVHKKRGTNKSMLYATDIVKLNNRKSNFLPLKNEDYPIFDEKIYSPMDGEIFKVVNNIDDNQPFSGNYPYNTGNTVVIKNGNYYFLLGHLKKGTIVVREGDLVDRNAFIARAGNSGMSERPHLHFQLMKSDTDDYWKGTGICIQFKGKNLYKNRLIKT